MKKEYVIAGETMKKNFKKSDLRTGMQVELRDSLRYAVMLDTPSRDVIVLISGERWDSLSSYNDNLKHEDHPSLDIVKVFSSTYAHQYTSVKIDEEDLLWEREAPKPILTLDGVEYSEETLRSLIKKATS